MKVLLAGADGQLGTELQRSVPHGVELLACDRRRLDVTTDAPVAQLVADYSPAVVINAAAYTRVDDAETQSEMAFAVNADGARRLARAAAAQNARCIQVSTDFVFDGRQTRPYRTGDAPNPLGVYGQSKLAGERAVQKICGSRGLIVRTSWLYSAYGSNFVKSMLKLMRERDELGVVADQVGSPTWAAGLAAAIWAAAARPELHGVLHWADAGVVSWYDFALAIQEQALERGMLTEAIPIKPLTTAQFPRPAPRPAFSALDCSETHASLATPSRHWRAGLAEMLEHSAQAAHA